MILSKIISKLNTLQKIILGIGWHGSFKYLLTKHRQTITLNIYNYELTLRKGTPDLSVALDSLSTEFNAVTHLLPKDFSGTLIDAGGYIGTAALKLNTLFPKARIITIEPSEENFALLQKNTSQHKHIIPLQGALVSTASQKEIPLHDRSTGTWGFTIVDQKNDDTVVNYTQAISLNKLLAKYPDTAFLKLDIEGGEHALLTQAQADLNKIPLLFIELHDRIVPGCHDAFTAFTNANYWVVATDGEKYLALQKT